MTGIAMAEIQYPFQDEVFPASEMAMTESPAELEALLREQARANGIDIIRDELVELVCKLPDTGEMRFMVFWPSGTERMNMLVPKRLAKGQA